MSLSSRLHRAIQNAADRGDGSTRAERVVLRFFVLTSAALFLAGLAGTIAAGRTASTPNLPELLQALPSESSDDLLLLALLTLCATPLARLVALTVIHLRPGRLTVALLAIVVMAMLGLGFLLGLHD
ncbi:MAG: DUF1634 domain-containing protein [Candidatus Eisenbacteria bacterium]|nr:DUF1634 domain-containing protein [Candidatus Eisenbacteria bacterium]MCC7140870.1 DUF1634 domain-containing protein [Candidatus Eisenbacteria bacterium]